MVARLRRFRFLAVATKSLIAAAVFSMTVGAYSVFVDDPRLRQHWPLPDGGVEDRSCTLWFVGSSSIHKWTSLKTDLAAWPAHNRGVNGALIDELEHRFALDRDRVAPAAVIVYAGENDIARGATADQAAMRITRFIGVIQKRLPRTPIILVDLKPSPKRWAIRAEQLRYNATMRETLAGRPGTHLIEVGRGLLVGGRPGPFYVEDDVHLNGAGYARWGGDIRHAFEDAMPRAQVAHCRAGGK